MGSKLGKLRAEAGQLHSAGGFRFIGENGNALVDMIRKIVVSNYRSLGELVEVPLGQITALVGPNAAGKSSVIDVLRFVSEVVRNGLPVALAQRNGLNAILRRGSRPDQPITIRVELEYPEGHGAWEFSLALQGEGDYRVTHEAIHWEANQERALAKLREILPMLTKQPNSRKLGEDIQKYFDQDNIGAALDLAQLNSFAVKLQEKQYFSNNPFLNQMLQTNRPQVDEMNLMLPWLSNFAVSLFMGTLRSIGYYMIFPEALRPPQVPDASRQAMDERGGNWISTLRRLKKETAGRDVVAALNRIVGDITDYKVNQVGGYLAVEFRHGSDTWLNTTQESDGTLRVAGLLTALLQTPALSLYAIEEPELSVHPGVLSVLLDFIRQASKQSQILLSTHSPELLDLLDVDQILVVERQGGTTTVAPVDSAQRELVKQRLLTVGDIVRSEGLKQDPSKSSAGSTDKKPEHG